MLTKSHFKLGKRCNKALYLNTFSPEFANPSSVLQLKLRDQGIEVGKYARSLNPEGILIDSEEIETALKETEKHIASGALMLFEAAFRFDNVIIRTDILTRESVNNPWNLYEVKATTSIKNEKLDDFRHDIGIQVWVLQQCGILLDGVYLMHLNSECVYPDLETLFICVNYWPEIDSVLSEISLELEKLKKILQNEALPNVSIGPHCEHSQGCSFKDSCWNHIPKLSVFDIPNCRRKWKFFEEGRVAVDQLSESDFKSDTHLRALKCYQENEPFFDKQLALELLQQWEYPISYFDIEAISYPIPRHPNSRPYQDLPFQFSCHIRRKADSDLEHYEFLHDGVEDPRVSFIEKMLGVLPKNGSIAVYHQTYEILRFKELARDFPEYAQAINDLIPRVVDLKKVIKDAVYYPGFMGSFSIKKVAPVLLGDQASYHHLEVSDGIEAGIGFLNMLNLGSNDPERGIIRKELLEYCKQDTLLMVHLHDWLLDAAGQNKC